MWGKLGNELWTVKDHTFPRGGSLAPCLQPCKTPRQCARSDRNNNKTVTPRAGGKFTRNVNTALVRVATGTAPTPARPTRRNRGKVEQLTCGGKVQVHHFASALPTHTEIWHKFSSNVTAAVYSSEEFSNRRLTSARPSPTRTPSPTVRVWQTEQIVHIR